VYKIGPVREPRGPDGDDRYEDSNGDGGVSVVNVRRLFARLS
jgi:hypothetical protein